MPTREIPSTVPIYQYHNSDERGMRFVYSTTPATALTDWQSDGVVFYGIKDPQLGTIPVYLFSGPDANSEVKYLYATGRNQGPGWSYMGIAFYAFSSQQANTVPIYQFYTTDINGMRFQFTTKPVHYPGWLDGSVIFYAYSGLDTIQHLIPELNDVNIKKVDDNLKNYYQLLESAYQVYLAKFVSLQTLAEIPTDDPGNEYAYDIINTALSAVAELTDLNKPLTIANVGYILVSFLYDRLMGKIEDIDLHSVFFDIIKRFDSQNAAMEKLIATLRKDIKANWYAEVSIPTNPSIYCLAHLANESFPSADNSQEHDLFLKVREAYVQGEVYETWKKIIVAKWVHWGADTNPNRPPGLYYTRESEQEAKDFVQGQIINNTENVWGSWYVINQINPHTWGITEHLLASPSSATIRPSYKLCHELFKDDPSGKLVNPDGAVTRAELFNNWGLTQHKYS